MASTLFDDVPVDKRYARYIDGKQMRNSSQSLSKVDAQIVSNTSSESGWLKTAYLNLFVRMVAYTAVGVLTGVAFPITFPICMFLIV